MFAFVRRISGSFLPRSDRPWSEDATSTAPTIGRKRRLSTPADEEEENVAKRARGDVDMSVRDESPAQVPSKETEEVKEVIQGVKEVELDDTKPETIPLPATPPPETSEADESAVESNEDQVLDPTAHPTSVDALDDNTSSAEAVTHDVVPETLAPIDLLVDNEALVAETPSRETRKPLTTAEPPSSKVATEVTEVAQSIEQTSDSVGEDAAGELREPENVEGSVI